MWREEQKKDDLAMLAYRIMASNGAKVEPKDLLGRDVGEGAYHNVFRGTGKTKERTAEEMRAEIRRVRSRLENIHTEDHGKLVTAKEILNENPNTEI
ncbi:MAG: hypothetical protein WCE94_08220 [Candidatus Methanoperedens sp.]